MKKFFALSLALALTFSTTVCAAETVVPSKDFTRIDTLSTGVEKAVTEYTQCQLVKYRVRFCYRGLT